jgi:hypothetical protein
MPWIVLRVFIGLIFFSLLTLFTQVGGVIFLLSFFVGSVLKKHIRQVLLKRFVVSMLFVLLYALSTLFIVPRLAVRFGREPLPWRGSIRPETIWTCVLNRHYVRPELRAMIDDAEKKMSNRYPGSSINYFDANFPFWTGFPLWPHLSHNDGRKLDIGLYYKDVKGKRLHDTPSPIGYGVFVDPLPAEVNYPKKCSDAGYWQYGVMAKIIPQSRKASYIFDSARMKYLIDILTHDNRMSIMLIEPHLKARMKLVSPKVRYHGCHAVRHDDHIHIQLRK